MYLPFYPSIYLYKTDKAVADFNSNLVQELAKSFEYAKILF